MDFDRINQLNQQKKQEAEKAQLLQTIETAGDKVASAVIQTERNTKKVTITNDLAKPQDINKVVEAVNKLGGELKPKDLKPVTDALDQVSQAIAKLPTKYPDFPEFPDYPEAKEDIKVTNLSELKSYFEDVVTAVGKLKTDIKFDPKIEIKPADVKVTEKNIDLTPITKGLANLEKALKSIETPNFDTTELSIGLTQVKESIQNLTFPASNFMLPFVDEEGSGAQIQLSSGKLPVEATLTPAPIFDIRNIEEDATYKYFGFEERGGTNWRIMRKTLATSAFLYATGTSDYATNWTGKAGLTYA
jgi:hypothetical protein